MNIENIYTYFPDYKQLIQISMEYHNVQELFSEMPKEDSPAVCIYGISEEDVQAHLEAYASKFESVIQKIKENLITDELWDVEIKPILLFDSMETAILFCNFANDLDSEQFYELINEIQLEFNTPWKSAKRMDKKIAEGIINKYN